MYVVKVPDTDPRLQKRYRKLVQQHLSTAKSVAAGLRMLPQTKLPFSAAQAAYRFYANDRVSLPQLAEPILAHAPVAVAAACREWCLVLHDWSPLHYTHHESKKDRIVLYNKNDFGYLMQTALLISDQNGDPLGIPFESVEISFSAKSRSEVNSMTCFTRAWRVALSRRYARAKKSR